VAYPVLALAVLLMVQVKFGRFWRTANPPAVKSEQLARPAEPENRM
jgi:hypothetical protein